MGSNAKILAFAVLGTGSSHEYRIKTLLSGVGCEVISFDAKRRIAAYFHVIGAVREKHPALVCMEGTGIAGGLALITARCFYGTNYVVSSGDAVGPFLAARYRALGPVFTLYERVLCRLCAGFIGWTPYLCGRALTFGAPRAMTAAGWAPFPRTPEQLAAARTRIRRDLGIAPEALVIGIAGSLNWTRRYRYCYGMELVRAVSLLKNPAIHALIVGEGEGRSHLEGAAAGRIGRTIHFTGKVSAEGLPDYLAAMDIGSNPQSVDGVGSFRYTTKISEYLQVGLPMVTGQIPLAYDLPGDWFWRLPGESPWDPRYIRALADLLAGLKSDEIAAKRAASRESLSYFDEDRQIRRVTEFITDLLAAESWAKLPPSPRA